MLTIGQGILLKVAVNSVMINSLVILMVMGKLILLYGIMNQNNSQLQKFLKIQNPHGHFQRWPLFLLRVWKVCLTWI
jgi:hypothetical protein